MRLATLQTPQGPRAAILDRGRYIDMNALDSGFPADLKEFLASGAESMARARSLTQKTGVKTWDLSTRLLAPILIPQKIICLGLNYRDHAAETKAPLPKDPILFSKYPSAIIGPDAPIVLPPVSKEVDYEAELVVVIGKEGRNIPEGKALQHVAGYTVGHDVSARDWQLKKDGKQWMAGKTFDTFAPLGPHLVTSDEISNPHTLAIQLRLNGQVMQASNTKEMIFGVAFVVSYLSQIFTLTPGDLIFTGTPPGVGMARNPPVYLKHGDVVEVEIENLGVLRNPVVQG